MCKWTPRYYAELDGRTPPDLRRETHAGTVLGTPGYMGASREEDDAEFRDVFGLGATLFRVVTGRMPYKAEPEVGDVLQWQAAERERLAEPLIEALDGALEPDPRARSRSITELRDMPELVVEELSMQAPSERPEPQDPPCMVATDGHRV